MRVIFLFCSCGWSLVAGSWFLCCVVTNKKLLHSHRWVFHHDIDLRNPLCFACHWTSLCKRESEEDSEMQWNPMLCFFMRGKQCGVKISSSLEYPSVHAGQIGGCQNSSATIVLPFVFPTERSTACLWSDRAKVQENAAHVREPTCHLLFCRTSWILLYYWKKAHHVKSHESTQVKSEGESRWLGTRNIRKTVKLHGVCCLKDVTIWGLLSHKLCYCCHTVWCPILLLWLVTERK